VKFVFIFISALLSVSALADEQPHTAERLAAIVSYVVADYPGAVKDGKIVAQSEYDEQRNLLAEGSRIAAELPGTPEAHAHLMSAYAAVDRAVTDKTSEDQLAALGRTVHKVLRDELGMVLTPQSQPSLDSAKALFTQVCARCHGADGRADTEEAKKLDPHPVSFLDEARLRRISPELAFQAMTFGVNGTGMASFDTVPLADRWSLAFYVTSLRHAGQDLARGRAALAKVDVAESPTRLATLTDDELMASLGNVPESDRAAALAVLRVEAPFRTQPGGRFAIARARLAELSANADDPNKARELAVAAYLEGVEPHEAALRAKDPRLSDRLEKSFLGLRSSIDAGMRGKSLRDEVARAQLVVDTVEERASGGASVPFLAAFAIAVREGFELSLLLAALLAFLRRAGRSEDARYVHMGWLAAIPAGAITWFAIGAALSGARREVTEGVLTLVAAAMLLFVSHFVLGRLESRRWLKFLEKKTMAAGGVGLALFFVAFVAAYREAIEIVLFFKALLLDSTVGPWPVAAGAAAGAVVLFGIVIVLNKLGRRLDPRPLMMVSSIVLTALAISLVGQGVRAFQEGGVVGLSTLPLPSAPALGLYPTVQGLLAQLVVLLLVIAPVIAQRAQAHATPAPQPR
jgi:high-affinity iron transporter